jgi:hypothetical protein
MKFKSWFILSEELYLQNNTATIFHRTKSFDFVQQMMNGGFRAGGGVFHGPGLYATYTLEGTTNLGYGDYVVKLKVNNLKNYFILEPDIAKQVHGDDYQLKDQARILKLKLNLTDEQWEKYQEISEDGQFGSANASRTLMHDGHFLWEHGCKGIIYDGSQDGKCICVYAPYKDLQFLAYAYAPTPTTVDYIEKNWVKSSKGVSIRSISDLKFPEDTGIGSTSVKKQYELEVPERVPLDIIYDFQHGKYSKLKLYLRKNKLNSQDIDDLLSGVSDKEKMAEILGPDNINKLQSQNICNLLDSMNSIDQMAEILGQDNINKLSGDHVYYLLSNASNEKEMAMILDQDNINKLTAKNVFSLLYNASNKDKIARILGPDNINKLTGDNVKDLLNYVNNKDEIIKILGSNNINKLTAKNIEDLISDAPDKYKMRQLLRIYSKGADQEIISSLDQ